MIHDNTCSTFFEEVVAWLSQSSSISWFSKGVGTFGSPKYTVFEVVEYP